MYVDGPEPRKGEVDELPSTPREDPGRSRNIDDRINQTRGDSALRRVRTNVRGDVDYRECESQLFSRFTALFVEADTKQSIA